MKSSKIQDLETIESLKKENRALKARLAKTKNLTSKQKHSNLKRTIIILLIGVAGAMLVVGNLVFWTGRTLTDTNKYVQATQPLIQNADIQNAIANRATTAIFDNINVEQIAHDILPPKAQFLAPSFASQAESFTNQQIKKIVSSNQFISAWQTVNARAHERLLNFVKNYQGDGTFDINDLYSRITQNLQEGKLSFLGKVNLPSSIGSIQLISAPNLPKYHWIVVNLWWIRLLSIFLFVLLTVLAIWLSKNKRRTLSRVGLLYAILMLATLLSLRIIKTMSINQVSKEYQSAVMAAWDIVLRSLIQQTGALMLVFVFVSMGAWFIGDSKHARILKGTIVMALNGNFQKAIYREKSPKFAMWLGKNKRIFEAILIFLAVLSLLIITLTPTNILLLVIVLVSLILVIELLGLNSN